MKLISILSLYAEGDMYPMLDFTRAGLNFNPLPLCRGRPETDEEAEALCDISILSLYAEGDI